jgi:hypothetical protein
VQNRLLFDYHLQKNKEQDGKGFRIFLLTQAVHYGALLLLFLGGVFFIGLALKAIFS